MKTHYVVGISMLCGIAIGATGIDALNAQQGKAKAYIINEVEVLDEAAFKEFAPKVGEVQKAAGGTYIVRGGKVASLEGTPPKRVTVVAYDSFEQAMKLRESAGWKALDALRAKAVKLRSFIVEAL